MMPRRRTLDRTRPWLPTLAVVLAGGLFLACSPGDGAPGEAGEEAAAMGEEEAGEGGMAGEMTAQEVPACRFTASGEELTGRASPPDSASARLDGGMAKICYGAPSMRDREIMGGLVPYDQPWRMGANEPTTLHVTSAAQVGGSVRVEPGSYALYAVPGESEWTITVNGAPERWGIPINEEVRAEDVGSFTVTPESVETPVETMSIRMESAQGGGANVILAWETTRVSFPIRPAGGM